MTLLRHARSCEDNYIDSANDPLHSRLFCPRGHREAGADEAALHDGQEQVLQEIRSDGEVLAAEYNLLLQFMNVSG